MSDTDHWFVGAFALWIEASADHLVQNGGHVTSPLDKKYKVTTQLRPPRDGFTLELLENTLGMRPVYGSIPVMEYLNNVNKIGIFLHISHISILMNHIYLYLYGWLQNTIAIFLLIVKTRKMPNGTKGNFVKALVNPGRQVRQAGAACDVLHQRDKRGQRSYTTSPLLLSFHSSRPICVRTASEIQPAGQIFHVSVGEDESSSSLQL